MARHRPSPASVAALVILVFSLAPAETLTFLDQDKRNGWLQEMSLHTVSGDAAYAAHLGMEAAGAKNQGNPSAPSRRRRANR
jgi:hypothetical protein